jgi:hypothetical protein
MNAERFPVFWKTLQLPSSQLTINAIGTGGRRVVFKAFTQSL